MCLGANQLSCSNRGPESGWGSPREWKCIYLIGEKAKLCISAKVFDLGSGGYSDFLKRNRMTNITERQIWQLAQRHVLTPAHKCGLLDIGGECLPNMNVITI